MDNQLTLNFEAGLASAYGSCRELVQSRVHQQDRQVKSIAADMDYSPSTLSRKLAQSPNDSQKLTLDDLESYIAVTGDKQPVFYFVEKYLTNEKTKLEELEAEIARLKQDAKLNS